MNKFKTVSFKNFMSYGNEMTTFRLDNEGITVITGVNGRGKSTMVDALSYALYGKPFRKATLPSIINDYNNGDLYVEVEFDTDDGSYKICRGMKPDILSVEKIGEGILNKDSTSKITQIMIDSILNMNYFLFRQLAIQSKTQYKPFLEFDSKERRTFVDRVFNLDVYRMMSKMNKETLSKSTRIKENLEKDIVHLESLIHTRKEHKSSIEESIANAEDIATEGYNKQLDKMKSDLQVIISEGKKFKELFDSLEEQKPKSRVKLDKEATELRDKKYDYKRSGEDASKMSYFFSNHDVCPTCTQNIKPQWKDKKIGDLEKLISELKTDWSIVSTELAVIENNIKEVDDYNSGVLLNNERKRNYHSRVVEFRNKFKELSMRISEFEEMGIVVKSTNLNLTSITQEIEAREIELKEKRIELEAVSKDILTYFNTDLILKDDALIATIINENIPILNERMNSNLGKMGIDMIFELDKNFNDTIYKVHGKTTSYGNLSEGEKLRVNLAMLMAWRELSVLLGMSTSNILLFDETFDSSMDGSGIEAFLEILTSMTDLNVYVITHTPSKFEADHSYNIVKENNFSKIIEE